MGTEAIASWADSLRDGHEIQGYIEQETFAQEGQRRFVYLLMGLVDVGEGGRAELSYLRRDGDLARKEHLLVSALAKVGLLTRPDTDHWRLPHRVMLTDWVIGREFRTKLGTRFSDKRRLLLTYECGAPAYDWNEANVPSFIKLAFGWLGNKEGRDAALHDYLCGGLTAWFRPGRFNDGPEDPLGHLPFWVLNAGREEWAEQLLDRAMQDRSWEVKGGFWALIAADRGRERWLKRIFASVPTENARRFAVYVDPTRGYSPLLRAARRGFAECVGLLVAVGADPNCVSEKDGTFPLVLAAQNGHAECVRLLLAGAADPNLVNDRDGGSALLMAAQGGHAECVRLLLDAGAEPNLVDHHDGFFPLFVAALEGHAECVRLLLDADADPNCYFGQTGMYPLLAAAENGHIECVHLLLVGGAEPNCVSDKSGVFPLLMAAQEGHAECTRLLLDAGGEPNRVNTGNSTFPLLMAAQHGHTECVRQLLARGAEPNKVDQTDGNSPLLAAANGGHTECIKLLLDCGVDPDSNRDQHNFPLLLAAGEGHSEAVRLLLERGAKPDRVSHQNGNFPLLEAAAYGHVECVRYLLDAGSDPNRVNELTDIFPLAMAAQGGHAECVRLLLAGGAEPNRVARGGIFSLLQAAQQGHAECVRLLLYKGAEPDLVRTENGAFPLLLAAQNGHTECVRVLLNGGAEPNRIHVQTSSSPLLFSAERGYAACVGLLLQSGAEPDPVDSKSGAFPLLMAAKNGHTECVRVLLDGGAEPNRVHVQTSSSPLLFSADRGYAACVGLLLQSGAEPDPADSESGAFPLLMAAKNGHAECIRLLLDAGAEQNRVDGQSNSFPLLLAANWGHAECVRLLLEAGAEPNQTHKPSGTTVLAATMASGHWPVATILCRVPGVLDSAPSEMRFQLESISEPEGAETNGLSHVASTATSREPYRQIEIDLPVFSAQGMPRDPTAFFWQVLKLSPQAVDQESVISESYRVNASDEAVISLRFRLVKPRCEVRALILDLTSFGRLIPLVPEIDLGGLALSLSNAGRPLDLRVVERAKLWASLLVIYRAGGAPVLPDSPWPPIPGATIPATPYSEEVWRAWNFTRRKAGSIVTLPLLLGHQLLRSRVWVPDNGIDCGWVGRHEEIMSGLRFPTTRFGSRVERGSPKALWLVREIEHG